MAYLILCDRDGEFDRYGLLKPATVGRAMDCEICVRDIMLSRKHCRIERFDGRWIVADLGSRNGTLVAGRGITRHALSDGDEICLGKLRIAFYSGQFVPAPAGQRRRDVRPVDPHEALAGTVMGFRLFDMQNDSRLSGFPIPRPRATEAAMVAQPAARSWSTAFEPSPDVQPHRTVYREISREPEPAQEQVHLLPELSNRVEACACVPKWLARTYIALACVVALIAVFTVLVRSM